MTIDDMRRIREYGKWLSTPDRIEKLRDRLNKAWTDKTPNNDPARVTTEARENVAKIFRQWVTSFVDNFATEAGDGESVSST